MLPDDAARGSPSDPASNEASKPNKLPRVLVVEDDAHLALMYQTVLRTAGFEVECAGDGSAALERFHRQPCDLVITDLTMPGMDGMDLLRNIRQSDPDVPVMIITAAPHVDSAMRAVEFGAHRYLPKPLKNVELIAAARHAVMLHDLARKKRRALAQFDDKGQDQAAAQLEDDFQDALGSLFVVYQPIVSWSNRVVIGYEALTRSRSKRFSSPGPLFEAAHRIGRLQDLSRRIRQLAPYALRDRSERLFINIDADDLGDEMLYDATAPLAQLAPRVVLELTERVALHDNPEAFDRVARLRQLGYALAIDDLGAGYAGLSSFAALQPEVCKLDMSLVRNIDKSPTKQKVVAGMVRMCRELSILLICEGVETAQECAVLVELGCDALQGYLFARPSADLTQPRF